MSSTIISEETPQAQEVAEMSGGILPWYDGKLYMLRLDDGTLHALGGPYDDDDDTSAWTYTGSEGNFDQDDCIYALGTFQEVGHIVELVELSKAPTSSPGYDVTAVVNIDEIWNSVHPTLRAIEGLRSVVIEIQADMDNEGDAPAAQLVDYSKYSRDDMPTIYKLKERIDVGNLLALAASPEGSKKIVEFKKGGNCASDDPDDPDEGYFSQMTLRSVIHRYLKILAQRNVIVGDRLGGR